MMGAEMQKAVADRQRAEAAKRKSDEMLTKELVRTETPSSCSLDPIDCRTSHILSQALKKDGETELRDAQRQLAADTERSEAVSAKLDASIALHVCVEVI